MQPRRRALGITAAACFGLLVSSTGLAHIDLLSPPPRQSGVPDANLDEGPCGQRIPGRVSEQVSVYRPGETITVAWDVYVQHSSYFRLSFDPDGDDSFSQRSSAPVDPARDDLTELLPGEGELILHYVMDRQGQLEHVEHSVTLPSEPCDNCTLQLTQFTYNLPIDEATYYQCADLTLEGEPVEPSTGMESFVQTASALGRMHAGRGADAHSGMLTGPVRPVARPHRAAASRATGKKRSSDGSRGGTEPSLLDEVHGSLLRGGQGP